MNSKKPKMMSLNPNEAEYFWKGVYLNLSTNPENHFQKYWSLLVVDENSNLPSSGIQFFTISDQYSAALAGLDVLKK